MDLAQLRKELRSKSDPSRAMVSSRFFKTGPGDYGEGDVFYGITVPEMRSAAKRFAHLPLREAESLLRSRIHEERLCALLLLVQKFESKTATERERKGIFDFYLRNTGRINNWDLVDLSSHEIVGRYLFDHPGERPVLRRLARSKSLWERRIAMVSCYYFIYRKEFAEPLAVATLLLQDRHDLIHKAVGWMLREMGKRDQEVLERFLARHYRTMPRTTLRYAIERFPEKRRKLYLEGKV